MKYLEMYLRDRFPVADVVSDECRDTVEALSLQLVLHSGVGFVQHHDLHQTKDSDSLENVT